MDASAAAAVVIEVEDHLAHLPAIQHCAWMLVNLLARQVGMVHQVLLVAPSGQSLVGRVVPLADRDLCLAEAILTGAAAIDAVPVTCLSDPGAAPSDAIRLAVGPGPAPQHGWRVHGEGWWGGISRQAIIAGAGSSLPLGPYAAACLAAGEVFKRVRLTNAKAADAFYSLWNLRVTAEPPGAEGQGPELGGLRLATLMAGGGAVGSAFVHVAWATPQLEGDVTIADADEHGVDMSNLNRCVIFGKQSFGLRKAAEAARICADASVTVTPHNGLVQEVADKTKLLVSAVDTNGSRQAIADMYPARLLSASTLDLRAEVLRCDPTADGACVRCFNPPEAGISDSELRRRFRAAETKDQEALAQEFSLSRADAERWAVEGTCSFATDRLMDKMRASDQGPEAFAVGFVSVTAGLMLFAQTAREYLGDPLLKPPTGRASLTLFDSPAGINIPRAYWRDENCPTCVPGSPGMNIWRRRHRAWE